jgi:hypothetical protein
MTAQTAEREITLGTEDVHRLASLAAALRAIGIVNQVQLRQQELTITRSGQQPFEIDFSGRVPFGFVFTAGHDATFHVPCGYRYWMEHISLAIPTEHDSLDVQMVTRSRHLFQQVSLRRGSDPGSDGDTPEMGAAPPILVHASTANTLLFSNGMEYGTSIVPAGSYVQMWGCLEPTDDSARE